jgi:hypothetical protein
LPKPEWWLGNQAQAAASNLLDLPQDKLESIEEERSPLWLRHFSPGPRLGHTQPEEKSDLALPFVVGIMASHCDTFLALGLLPRWDRVS